MRTIITLFICHLFISFQFLLIDIALANEWGLEKQNMEHGKCDSIILHYDGTKFIQQSSNTTNWLGAIWGIDKNNIISVGDNGTMLYYDGAKWIKHKSVTNYLLLGIWGNRKDNFYVVGYNPESHH